MTMKMNKFTHSIKLAVTQSLFQQINSSQLITTYQVSIILYLPSHGPCSGPRLPCIFWRSFSRATALSASKLSGDPG